MNTKWPQHTPSARKLSVPVRLLTFLIIGIAMATPAIAQQIADSARQQIAAIEQMKRTFTPAEQKMSSGLVIATRLANHQPVPEFAARLLRSDMMDSKGRIEVSVHGSNVDRLSNDIVRSGGEVRVHAGPQSLRARVGLDQIALMAADPRVNSIHEAWGGHTNVGAVTSQGYISHGANLVVAKGITGQGVNVGVLSDSATPARVAALIASGDLPANVTVLPGESGAEISGVEDEGAAMMEIVHDLAPGANLFFATAFHSESDFANNIRMLRFIYHCDIIVDDITYFDEGAFQDGTVAQAVNDVVANGALYFSAAANSGNLTLGTSGTWEGDFNDGGPVTGTLATAGETGEFHNFGTTASPQNFDRLKATSTIIDLKWSDPLGGSSNDYDLFVLNSAGTSLKAFSADAQTGTQDPFEILSYNNPAVNDRIVVVLFSGDARALRVDTNRGQLTIATAGSTFGHNAGLNTVSTAAVYWNSAKTGAKPFVGGAANPIETFSSDGPRKIFYEPDGTPITPGNVLFSTNGGTTLQKPDVAAADGIYTHTPGFLPFFGTSAAAPHAAAVAALVKSAKPSLTNAQIKQILINTAVDNMAAGVDRDSGYGIVLALPAVQSAQH